MIDRRRFVTAASALVAMAHPVMAATAKRAYPKEKYARAVVIDALSGPGGDDETSAKQTLSARALADAKASGVTALNLTVHSPGNAPHMFEDAVASLAFWQGQIELHPNHLLKVRSAGDLQSAKTSHRLGLIFGFQDTNMLEGDLTRVALFHGLGLRIIQPVYNRRNLMGDGCLEPADGGLSTLGRELIQELNRLNILLDLSHAGPRTIAEGIAASKAPMAITHTGCRALVDVPRNTHDSALKALADRGGVAGIFFMPFLRSSGQPHSEDVIRHLEHAVNVCGEDHVGLGTDGFISEIRLDANAAEEHRKFFEERVKAGVAAPGEAADVFNLVPEYNDPLRFFNLANDLSARGWSDARIEKVLGGNFGRLFREVWT
jgi:membrane dipeptidase